METEVPGDGMAGMEIDTPAGGETSVKKTSKYKSAAVSGPKDRFEVKKWKATLIWAYDSGDTLCAIYKHDFQEQCIDCMGAPGIMEPECQVCWGICNHAYHFHCISKWTKNHPPAKCPLCSGNWELLKYGR